MKEINKKTIYKALKPVHPILQFCSDVWNPYPKCRGCNKEERLLLMARVIFLIALSITGIMLINQVEGDVKSKCCTQLLECAKVINPNAQLIEDGVNVEFNSNFNFDYIKDADIPKTLDTNDLSTH